MSAAPISRTHDAASAATEERNSLAGVLSGRELGIAATGATEERRELAGVLSVREPGIPASSEGDKASAASSEGDKE